MAKKEKKDAPKCMVDVRGQGTYGWLNSHKCGKPAKGTLKNGTPACGLHIYGECRREESRKKWDQKWEDQKEFSSRVSQLCDRVCLDLHPSTSVDSDRVHVSWEPLQKLFEELLRFREHKQLKVEGTETGRFEWKDGADTDESGR